MPPPKETVEARRYLFWATRGRIPDNKNTDTGKSFPTFQGMVQCLEEHNMGVERRNIDQWMKCRIPWNQHTQDFLLTTEFRDSLAEGLGPVVAKWLQNVHRESLSTEQPQSLTHTETSMTHTETGITVQILKTSSQVEIVFTDYDTTYYVRDNAEAQAFFIIGRVFSVLEHIDKKHWGYYERYSNRLVVVRLFGDYVWALPVTKHEDWIKLGEEQRQAYAVIYEQGQTAATMPGDTKKPIEVRSAKDVEPLNPASRLHINYPNAIYTNVQVKDYGIVGKCSLPYLLWCFKEEYPEEEEEEEEEEGA